jgi:hypothetical protein
VTARFFLMTTDIFFFFHGLSTSQWMYEGLHCKHRPASTVVRDIEQRTMLTSVHGAAGALSMGPSTGYASNLTISMFSKVFILLNMISMFIIVATCSTRFLGQNQIHMICEPRKSNHTYGYK